MKNFRKFINNIDEYVMMMLLAYIAIIVFLQVIMRYIVGNALSWSEESIRFAFVWLSLLGISIGLKYDKHIRIMIVFNSLSKRGKYILTIIVNLIFIAVCLIIFIYGIETTLSYLSSEFKQVSPALEIPMYIVYAACPAGYGLGLVRLILKFIRDLKPENSRNNSVEKSDMGEDLECHF